MSDELYKIEQRDDIVIIAFELGDFLHDVNDQLMKGFELLWAQGHKKMVLDMAQTNYVSSLILASLVFIQKRAKDSGGALVICGIKPRVQEILTMTNLDKVFEITKTREEAVALLKKK